MKKFRVLAPTIFLATLLVASPVALSESDSESSKEQAETSTVEATVDVGFFVEDQIEPGFEVYDQHCAICHGYTLQSGEMGGPPLTGSYFFNRWGGRTVGELLEYIHANMPLGQGGSLRTREYEDVTAYVLDYNDFPSGEARLEAESEVLSHVIEQPEQE